MFDLEQSIAEWRRQMLAAGIKTPVPLEELESHLREEIERQVKSGSSPHPAFVSALGQMGRADLLKQEFVKAGVPIRERLRQFAFSLAGIPNYQPAPNLEPRWATYAKGGTFLFPAAFFWMITIVFVLPKVNEICQAAGTTVFNFEHSVPAIIRAWAAIGQVMILLTNHWLVVGSTMIFACILLERYFSQWPRFRRAAIGVGAFLLNAVVLLSLTLMIISILVAAPALTHHIR